tara:strand:- start:1671 stop:1934 length:264 start_codon:yes stop_codon:yes gene_type:complete
VREKKMKKVDKNPDLLIPVSKNNPLKEMIVEYVGTKLQPENDEVTVEMVVDVFSTDFPEFLMPVAEENYIRGYTQALDDVENTYTGE